MTRTSTATWAPDTIHLNYGLYELKIHPDEHVMFSTRMPYRLRHQIKTKAAEQDVTMEQLVNRYLEKMVTA